MSRACTGRRRPPSRACCSPPGAVSEGLRGFDPLGLGQSSRAVARRAAGEGRTSRGAGAGGGAGRQLRRAGGRMGLGRASLPPAEVARQSCAPRSPAPPRTLPAHSTREGRGPRGTEGAEVLWVGLREGRSSSTLDRGGHIPCSRTSPPRRHFPNQRSLLPASCVRPARSRELGALPIWLREQHPVPGWLLRAREGG